MSGYVEETTCVDEYITFIKKCLINQCYMEYCNKVYEESNEKNRTTNYTNVLSMSIHNKDFWDNVFKCDNTLFTYYLCLTRGTVTYSPEKTISVYEQISFQEFIDKKVDFQKIGYREYQKFLTSMKDATFKNRIIEQYKQDMESKNLKNHIIYIISLKLTSDILKTKFVTEEETADLDSSLNPISYFKYLYKGATTDNNDDNLNISKFKRLEEEVHRKIRHMFRL